MFDIDFSQWTDYDTDDDFERKHRHHHHLHRDSHHKSDLHIPQSLSKVMYPQYYDDRPNSSSENVKKSHHLFVKNQMPRAHSGEFYTVRKSKKELPLSPGPLFRKALSKGSSSNSVFSKEEENGGELLMDLEMLPLTGRVNVNLIKVRNVSTPGITCSVDDWYFAKLEMVCSSSTRSKVTKRRTEKYHAEIRRATDHVAGSWASRYQTNKRSRQLPTGDVMTTTGNWLEVNFNEQFNFTLRATSGGKTKEAQLDDSEKPGANLDCRLTVSVYCQRGKHRQDTTKTKTSTVDCGLMQSILPSMKQLIGTCSLGTSVNGLGGEHWEEAEKASEKAALEEQKDINITTISRWHPLIANTEKDVSPDNKITTSRSQPPSPTAEHRNTTNNGE